MWGPLGDGLDDGRHIHVFLLMEMNNISILLVSVCIFLLLNLVVPFFGYF